MTFDQVRIKLSSVLKKVSRILDDNGVSANMSGIRVDIKSYLFTDHVGDEEWLREQLCDEDGVPEDLFDQLKKVIDGKGSGADPETLEIAEMLVDQFDFPTEIMKDQSALARITKMRRESNYTMPGVLALLDQYDMETSNLREIASSIEGFSS